MSEFDGKSWRSGSQRSEAVQQVGVPGKRTLLDGLAQSGDAAVHQSAQRGIATPAVPLPHLNVIQRAFGRHDVSGVKAHAGGEAAASAQDMGAAAYATGDHVVLGAGTDLHTVAHEAAHAVQQRGGVQLKGGVGAAGDAYERHADAVADLVVQGKSAESLLDQHASPGAAAAQPATVQHKLVVGSEKEKLLLSTSTKTMLRKQGASPDVIDMLSSWAEHTGKSYQFDSWDDAIAVAEERVSAKAAVPATGSSPASTTASSSTSGAGSSKTTAPKPPARTTKPPPTSLYHATPVKNAKAIAKAGLAPMSKGGEGAGVVYSCWAATDKGVATISPHRKDIIFKVDTAKTPGNEWYPKGAGAGGGEWRSRILVPAEQLTWKRVNDRTGPFGRDERLLD